MTRFFNTKCSVSCFVLITAALAVVPVGAQVFTLDGATAPINGVAPDDLLLPGPAILLPGALGIPLGPPPVDIDGFTFSQVFAPGYTVVGVDFSVAPGSVGSAGTAVFAQSAFGDEPADIYSSGLGGFNVHTADGNGAPPGPALPLGVIEPGSNVNGWDATPPFGPASGIFYSVTTADTLAHPLFAGASGADIFFAPPVPGYSVTPAIFATAGGLGLLPGDDIDALAIIEDGSFSPSPGDDIFFSLTPGSPTLGVLGVGPGDILLTKIGGAPALAFPAAALGLLPSDDVDALDLVVVPEPSAIALWVVPAAMILRRRRA